MRGLIVADMAHEAAEREAGLRKLPPGMVAILDLRAVWAQVWSRSYSTRHLVAKLVDHNPDYWGPHSPYGKQLTDTRLARLVNDGGQGDLDPSGRAPAPAGINDWPSNQSGAGLASLSVNPVDLANPANPATNSPHSPQNNPR